MLYAKEYMPDPYKGLLPYSEADRLFFFGRERLRKILIDNLKGSRLTVLYGPSGVGKSSILQAGVVFHLRQVAEENMRAGDHPGSAIVVFPPPITEGQSNSHAYWREDPLTEIKQQIKAEIERLGVTESPEPELPFAETLQEWTKLIGKEGKIGNLYIILDQFEEYFLSHPLKAEKDPFAVQFPAAVNYPNLNVNFLIAIREDALAKLDAFKGSIGSLLNNRLLIEYLDDQSATEAIEKPVAEYNRQLIILNHLLTSRLTVLSGDSSTHKSTILRFGLAHYLRQAAEKNVKKGGKPGLAIILFDRWCKEPLTEIGQQIKAEIKQLGVTEFPEPELPFAETLQEWTKLIAKEEEKGKLFIILDQFEDCLDYLPEDSQDKVIQALSEVVQDSRLNVNCLISLHKDYLGDLCRFKDYLTSDSLKYLYLSQNQKIFEGTDPESELRIVSIESGESDLAKAVLSDVRIEQNGSSESKSSIEAPYLQLIMTQLWQKEQQKEEDTKKLIQPGEFLSLQLRKSTYTDLGADRIVKEHLYNQIKELDECEREMASRILYYLVTPSGTQLLALSSEDLVKFANQNRLIEESELEPKQVKDLLEKLSHGALRILCPEEGDRYKIFFSLLTKEVWNWVQLQHKIKYLEREAEIALKQFKSSQLKGLRLAMKAGQLLREGINENKTLAGDASTVKVIETLQTILQDIREKNEFKPSEGSAFCVNFSPDGQQLAIGASDGTIQLWDLQKNQLDCLDKLDGFIYYICFSPEGKKLAVANGLGNICLWDLQNHRQINPPLREGNSPFYCLSFSGDGQKLAAGAGDGTSCLWDLQKQQLAKGEPQDNLIYFVSLSADGKMLATSSLTGPLVLWQLDESQKKLKNVTEDYVKLNQEREKVTDVTFSPRDRMKLATGLRDGRVYLWNLENVNGEPTIFTSQEESQPISHVDFNSKGNQLTTVSLKGRVCLWNVEDNQKPKFTTETNNDILYNVDLSPDGKQLAIVQWDGIARLWALQPQESQEFKQEKTDSKNSEISLWVWNLLYKETPILEDQLVTHISFNPNQQHGQQLAIGFQNGKVKLYDLDREDQSRSLESCHDGAVYRICFSSDGKQLATASADGTFQVYKLENEEKKENEEPIFFKDIKTPIYGISFSHDGNQLFTGSEDGIIRQWDLGQREKIHEIRGHHGPIYHLSVSPDGQKLATASGDCTVRLWNIEENLQDNLKDKKLPVECQDHQGPAYWVSFSLDGQQLATSSGDGTVRLWNLEGKERDGARCIHPAPIFCVNFIPGKPELVTACCDGKVRLWNLRGKLLAEFPIARDVRDIIMCVNPSFDGKLLATVSNFWNGKAILLERRQFDVQKEINSRIKDLDQLLNQGWDWLEEDYFAAHPEVRQDF